MSQQPQRSADACAGPTSEHVLKARALTELILSEAAETERLATASPKVVQALRDSGLLWFQLPRELGGGGADLVEAVEVLEELTFADGSVGWAVMATSAQTSYAGAVCGDVAVERIFGGREPGVVAGMAMPGGSAVYSDGRLVGKGRYRFASGSGYATWFSAGMMVSGMEPGKPPVARVALLPREKIELIRNWDVMGLCGTGSHDFDVPEQPIDVAFTFDRDADLPKRGGAHFKATLHGLGHLGHCAVALGLMKRALTEVSAIAGGKKRVGYASAVADYAIFRHDFAHHEASYQAARTLVLSVFGSLQDDLRGGQRLTAQHKARYVQACSWVHRVASDVVRFCHLWGSTEAIRNPSVLGRCMRDTYTATQHIFVDPIRMEESAAGVMSAWTRRDAAPGS